MHLNLGARGSHRARTRVIGNYLALRDRVRRNVSATLEGQAHALKGATSPSLILTGKVGHRHCRLGGGGSGVLTWGPPKHAGRSQRPHQRQ